MNSYKPFFDFLLKWLDKPLAAIGMSKTAFFSMLLFVSYFAPELIPAEWAEWIRQALEITQGVSVFGLGLAIDDRLKAAKQFGCDKAEPTTSGTKLW